MGTSRMTSVRPSWSRGKMTTFRAGRSAWKLNQRQSRQQEDGGRPAVGSGVSPTPGLKQKRPRGPERVERTEGALLLGMGRRCFCGGTERTHWVPAEGGGRGRPACSAAGKQPVGTAPMLPCSGREEGTPRDLQNQGQYPQRVERRGRAEPTGHRPLWRGTNSQVRGGSHSARREKQGSQREPGAIV